MGHVLELREWFGKYDAEGTGNLGPKKVAALIEEVFPDAEKSKVAHQQAKEMLRTADANRDGSLDFEEFLTVLRLVADRSSKAKVERERQAVQDTGLIRRERKEFRQVFRAFDTDESGDMSFDELQ